MEKDVSLSPGHLPVPISTGHTGEENELATTVPRDRLLPLAPSVTPVTLYEAWQMGERLSGIFLLYGHPHVLRLSQKLACRILLQPEPMMVLDGANTFDPYLVSELARKVGQTPEEFLRRIRVSRSFTCHQMLSLIRQVEKAARQWNSCLILLLGPLTTFYDESVPNHEAWAIFRAFVSELNRLSQAGFRLLLACQQPAAATGRVFVKKLKLCALGVASCWPTEVADQGVKDWLLVQVEKPAGTDRHWLVRQGEIFRPRSYLS
ncbi:MAG TPA: hypothetical protein VMW38_00810 [Terriglobia bacterium]|nr:hypothetical protein [Terriglobia bacterium]